MRERFHPAARLHGVEEVGAQDRAPEEGEVVRGRVVAPGWSLVAGVQILPCALGVARDEDAAGG